MSSSTQSLDFSSSSRAFIPVHHSTCVGLGEEVKSGSQTTLVDDSFWLTGMAKVPENISDVIVNRLGKIAHVKAVLMGRSGEVYHVWTMIDKWTVAGRKEVYSAQKELLAKLRGFDLDFYVVPLDDAESPEGLVSEIPTVFQRAS